MASIKKLLHNNSPLATDTWSPYSDLRWVHSRRLTPYTHFSYPSPNVLDNEFTRRVCVLRITLFTTSLTYWRDLETLKQTKRSKGFGIPTFFFSRPFLRVNEAGENNAKQQRITEIRPCVAMQLSE